MKKILNIIFIVVSFIFFELIISFILNQIYIYKYNKDIYNETLIESLLMLNISEPCIAHYNYGNALYKMSDYNSAIDQYEKALDLYPTKQKECDIRVNLALAMLKQIKKDYASDINKDETIQILNNARDVLCEKGCANKDDNNGHSVEAEQLKADIDKMLEKLNKEQDQEKPSDSSNKPEEEQSKEKEKKIEEQLLQLQKESRESRQEEIMEYQNYEDHGYFGRNW